MRLKLLINFLVPTLIIGLAFFLWRREAPLHDNTSHDPDKPIIHIHQHPHHSSQTHQAHHHHPSTKAKNQAGQAVIKKARAFSYREEVERINDLRSRAKTNPEVINELIEVVLSDDPYKENDVEVAPHTIDDIKQNQIGAVKVLALQAITQTTSAPQVSTYLLRIIQESQDPTIRKIAQAMLDSHRQGRSFVKDFTDGIINLDPIDKKD